jgi:anti-sigma factor RsiW
MSHQRIKQQLSEYLEGDLAHGARQRIEIHLVDCDGCVSELSGLRQTRDLLRGLPTPEPPPDLAQAVMDRLRAGAGTPGPAARLAAWWADFSEVGWPAPIAAAAVALVAVAVLQGGDSSFVWGTDPGEARVADAFGAAPEISAPLLRASPSAAEADRRAAARREQLKRLGEQPSVFMAAQPPVADLPPFEACLHSGETPEACIRWHAWTVGLGLRDPDAFLQQIDELSSEERQVWLGRLADFAARSGSAPMLARELRGRSHPSAADVANRIESGAPSGR